MPTISKKQYEDYERLCHDRKNGRLLTPDGLRLICSANGYDAEAIGKHFLELLQNITQDVASPRPEHTSATKAPGTVDHRSDPDFIYRISEFLSAKGLRNESAIDNSITARKNGKQFPLSEHIRGLIYSLLTNQVPWKRIVPHLSEVDRIFMSYDAEAILAKPGSYFEGELRKIRCGNRKTKA